MCVRVFVCMRVCVCVCVCVRVCVFSNIFDLPSYYSENHYFLIFNITVTHIHNFNPFFGSIFFFFHLRKFQYFLFM